MSEHEDLTNAENQVEKMRERVENAIQTLRILADQFRDQKISEVPKTVEHLARMLAVLYTSTRMVNQEIKRALAEEKAIKNRVEATLKLVDLCEKQMTHILTHCQEADRAILNKDFNSTRGKVLQIFSYATSIERRLKSMKDVLKQAEDLE